MDFLRKIVSGPKNRYKKDGYNLDLTYVTERVIGMSFPAEGFEKLYRNSLDEVAKFIKDQHNDNYLIFNLSCRTYNYDKFGGKQKIISYQWEDHHSPPLHMLFDICEKMHIFLQENPKNVVIVHCKAGKGRTGTVICSYFLYTDLFKHPKDSLDYYGKKRFQKDGLGVNQPCQRRYVYYFWQILQQYVKKQPNLYPQVKYIKNIKLQGRPNFSDDGCKPYFEVYDVLTQKLLLTTKKMHSKDQRRFEQNQNEFICKFDKSELAGPNKPLHGDILVKFIDHCKWTKNTKMGRVAFNTAFIEGNQLIFGLEEISPSQVIDDKRFPHNFQIIIEFQDRHCNDNQYTPFEKMCEGICSQEWNKDKKGKNNWEDMYNVLVNYQVPPTDLAKQLLFGQGINDIQQILQLEFNDKFSTQQQLSPILNQNDDYPIANKQQIQNSNQMEFSINLEDNNQNQQPQKIIQTKPRSQTQAINNLNLNVQNQDEELMQKNQTNSLSKLQTAKQHTFVLKEENNQVSTQQINDKEQVIQESSQNNQSSSDDYGIEISQDQQQNLQQLQQQSPLFEKIQFQKNNQNNLKSNKKEGEENVCHEESEKEDPCQQNLQQLQDVQERFKKRDLDNGNYKISKNQDQLNIKSDISEDLNKEQQQQQQQEIKQDQQHNYTQQITQDIKIQQLLQKKQSSQGIIHGEEEQEDFQKQNLF